MVEIGIFEAGEVVEIHRLELYFWWRSSPARTGERQTL
jgi:hypothetical protein